MVYVFLAEGFEEVEALTPVDWLRRAGVEVALVGVTGKTVVSSHKVSVNCDLTIDQIELSKAEMIVLPGGLPGAQTLADDARVQKAVREMVKNDKYVAAICAAPSLVLGSMGLLEGKKATCYPSMEDGMKGAQPQQKTCVVDGKFVTACGLGGAMDFGYTLVSLLCGADKAEQIRKAVVYHVYD